MMQVSEKTIDSILLKPRSLLDGHLQLLLPDGFVPMGDAMLKTKYPNEARPNIVFTNEMGSINIAINHTRHSVSSEQLKQLHQQLDTSIRRSTPNASWRFSGFQNYNGREWTQLEFISPAIDTTITNIMVATSLENRMLAVSFNVTEELAGQWQRVGREIIKSLSVID